MDQTKTQVIGQLNEMIDQTKGKVFMGMVHHMYGPLRGLNFILDNAPPEVIGGVKILGKWFSEQNKGVNTPGSGRDAVNNLIKGGLLARDGKRGKIIAGPKLVTALSACVVV